MAMTAKLPKQFNWKLWGGATLAALVVLGALGYWFDWFGTGTADAIAPAVEETAPVGE
ncbi:MAG: hypothetical protein AAFY42_11000 [Pseudomonadota bacterium]